MGNVRGKALGFMLFIFYSSYSSDCPLPSAELGALQRAKFDKALEFAARAAAAPEENYVKELDHLKRGREFFHDIKFGLGDKVPTQSTKDYLLSIAAMVWYLHQRAMEKDQDCKHSTICFKSDRTMAAMHLFLMNFVKKVTAYQYNPEDFSVISSPLDKQGLVANNPFAYMRRSTHFHEDAQQYGIDMRFEIGESARPILYNESMHLLFGAKFIKPEPWGLNFGIEWYGHVWNLIKSIARKNAVTKKLLLLESDDASSNRKERVPQSILNAFSLLIHVQDKDTEVLAQIQAIASKQGIRFMYETIKEAVEKEEECAVKNEAFIDHGKAFLAIIETEYDHIEKRKGREIILDDGELFDVQ